MSILKDSHNRVVRSLRFALTLGGFDSWHALGLILKSRLTTEELGGIAYAAIHALGAELSEQVFRAAHGGAGAPIAPLQGHLDEAAFWADMAQPDELEAYCLASFKAMPATRKAAFLDFVQGRAAA